MTSALRRALIPLAVLGAALLGSLAPASASSQPGDYSLVGHRGFPSNNVTENTIASLNRARNNGATAVEVDLDVTRDRGYVVMHDSTLDRTTTCSGPVIRRTLAEIQSGCRGRLGDEYIPSLDTLLNWAQGKGINLILEIKRVKADSWGASDFLAIDAAVRAHGLADRVIYHALHDGDLKTLKEAVPTAHVQAIADSWDQAREQRTWADGINLPADALTAARVKSLHEDGLLVLGRETDDPRDWRRLRQVGVDGLLTDDTSGYREWVR